MLVLMPSHPPMQGSLSLRWKSWVLPLATIIWCLIPYFPPAFACQLVDPPVDQDHVLWVHLDGTCSSHDKEEHALTGDVVLDALKEGKSLDLKGVLIRGDVMLDQLPLRPLAAIAEVPSEIVTTIQERGIQEVRVIPGKMVIRDSEFENVLATNLAKGALIVRGEVDFEGSRFAQSVDFSKMIFARSFSFKEVKVGFEGFFIGAHFTDSADFSTVTFGTHTRFHKARFGGPVSFSGTTFQGVAEFLEVEFQGPADFSGSAFHSGTGFSGSNFHGPLDFSGVRVDQAMYFRFAEFAQQASFRASRFSSVLDFSNSRFLDRYDFSDVELAFPPELSRSSIRPEDVPEVQGKTPWDQIVIFSILAILILVYLWRRRTARGSI